MLTRAQLQRAAAIVMLALATVAVAVTLLTAGGPYIVHARFIDAGQLVKGDVVEVGGRPIGTVSDIRLTANNQADVVLKITEGAYQPLHRGTTAGIRTVGLSGVANRFVDIFPGPETAEEIADGGTLATSETRPIVDLDYVLNALDAPTRERLQGVIRNGAKIYGGDPESANRALEYLNPAISQIRAISEEVVRDQAAFEELIASGADTSSALAAHSDDIEEGITNSATTMRAIARERAALQDTLGRAPAVLRQANGTLRGVRGTLDLLRPVLRDARPVAPRLASVLRALVPTARATTPVLRRLRAQLPNLDRTLAGLPALDTVARPAVGSLTTTLGALTPIVRGLRPYTPDLAAGLINGFGGTTSGYYDANGHFVRISPHFGQAALAGLGQLTPGIEVADLLGTRTKILARCPGGAVEPADDRSNPYIEDPSTCNPEHNKP